MATERTQTSGRSARRSAVIVAALLTVVTAAAVLFGALTDEAALPAGVPDAILTTAPVPEPEPTTPPDEHGQPDLDPASTLDPAPLGAYVVAKPAAGAALVAVQAGQRQIPVYDIPGGPPRTMLAVNKIDGVDAPLHLIDWDDPAGALVLRLIAGGPNDDWLIVQAPTRPHDQYVWVRRSDFEFGFTSLRIEIDLADAGLLQLFDGNQVVLRAPIVQGRDGRRTPTHLTYIQNGVLGEGVAPAYGPAILSMASFSEDLGTFGGGGLPSNFIHGTNQPDLMGQRVSSGEIRVPNENLQRLLELITPGTPVLLFDSSESRPGRDDILQRVPTLVSTIPFEPGTPGAVDVTAGVAPQLWRRCGSEDPTELLCRSDGLPEFFAAGSGNEHVFAVARPDAGDDFLLPGQEFDPRDPPVRFIPVYDEPNGSRRSLVYVNDIDRVELDYPLLAQTVFGEPLVLSVVKMSSDAQWLLVRAPVLPHGQVVWVRGSDFDLGSTTLRIEVDVGYEFLGRYGMLTVWDNGRELLSAKISAGRETRPTTLTATYVDQIIPGVDLGQWYGPWLFSTPTYSETLGTFGGGDMPQQAIHAIGEDIEDQLGQPMSSGSIHVATETALRLAEIEGLVGAPVIFYDSSSPFTNKSAIERAAVAIARTKPMELTVVEQPVGGFT